MTMVLPQIAGRSSNGWALALRGLAGIVLGMLAFAWPEITITALVTVFGLYAIVDGLFAIVAALRGVGERDRWGWMLVEGIASVIAGTTALLMPLLGALVLTWIVALWAIVTGALEMAAAVRLRKIIEHEWMLMLAGMLSLALGVVIALQPGVGLTVIVTYVGAYALVAGAVTLVLAFRIRKWAHEHG
jgi:uncharacterized membrane protein HdeD (DUF308 family)